VAARPVKPSSDGPSPGRDVFRLGAGQFDYAEDGRGDDQFMGGDGRDQFGLGYFANSGTDVFRGGAGTDTVIWASGGSFVADLTLGQAGVPPELDTVHSIEIVSGSTGDDTLLGSAGADMLFGEGGDDHIEGRDGDDWLDGFHGIDFLDGGAGTDRCEFGETVMNCET
jgi:Ca2+-binding RTX toxin-like protein